MWLWPTVVKMLGLSSRGWWLENAKKTIGNSGGSNFKAIYCKKKVLREFSIAPPPLRGFCVSWLYTSSEGIHCKNCKVVIHVLLVHWHPCPVRSSSTSIFKLMLKIPWKVVVDQLQILPEKCLPSLVQCRHWRAPQPNKLRPGKVFGLKKVEDTHLWSFMTMFSWKFADRWDLVPYFQTSRRRDQSPVNQSDVHPGSPTGPRKKDSDSIGSLQNYKHGGTLGPTFP